MERRVVSFFALTILAMFLCILSIYTISEGDVLAETAQRQSSYRLTVAETRGTVYDCSLLPLTGESEEYVAAVAPAASTAASLNRVLGEEAIQALAPRLHHRYAGRTFYVL